MKLGKFNIDVLDTGIFALDGGAMFGVVPKSLWSRAYDKGDELNRIPLAARPMLIRWGDRNLLIDTGNGTKFSEKLAKIYDLDREKSNIANALSKFGLNSGDITDVILTHLHFDHAGGATTFENDELVPTFKNAKYYIQKEHFQWAENPSDKDRASFMKDNYIPLKSDGLLDFTEGKGELFPGIDVIPVNGHTQAMQIVKISSDSQSLLYAADLCPTASHIPAVYVMGYDNNPLVGIDEKKAIFSQAYEEGWIIAYEHDAFKQATVVNANEKGFYAGDSIIITE